MYKKNWVAAVITAIIGFVTAPTAVSADSIFWQPDYSVLYGNTDTLYIPWLNTSFVAFNQVIEQLNNNQPIGVVGTVTSFTIYAENPEDTIAYAYLPNTQLMWGPSKWEGDRGNEGAAGNFGYMTTVSATSTGHYVTFQLSSPVVLDPNTYYLISLGYTRQLPNDPQSMGVLGGSMSGTCSNYWGGSLPTLRCPGFNQFAYWLNDESGYNGILNDQSVNHKPTLTLPTETNYADNGLYPDKGVADKDVMTFKTVYADVDGTPADKVHVVVDTTVDFNTDEFYKYHVTLPGEAGVVDGVDIFYDLIGTRVVGLDRGLFDGKGLNEGDVLTLPLLRSNIRRATTTLAVVESMTRIGDANGEFKLEALGTSGHVLAQQSIVVDLPNGVPDNINVPLAVSADADIASLRLTVLHTNDTVGWLKNIMTEADVPMQNDGDNSHFTASSTFPKGNYTYFFTASSTDGLAARYPESGELSFTTGYSNVAFLPGIKASRLYQQGICYREETYEPYLCDIRLWESTDTLLQKLKMDYDGTTGKSDFRNIFTKDVIDQGLETASGENIYLSFLESMDMFKSSGAINDWEALPYDWRLDFDDVLEGGDKSGEDIYYDDSYSTDTPYILQELKHLVETSDSGKVTIVAHSMGGLIAKKLLYELEHNADKEPYKNYKDLLGKVDTVVLVASPQLGTPQALASILHGYNEDIFSGVVASGKTSRKLAYTMQSAYNLLPANKYTETVSDLDGQVFRPADSALVSFDDTTLANLNDPQFDAGNIIEYYRTRYSNESSTATTSIRSYDAMRDFMEGNDGHPTASTDDLLHPLTFEDRTKMLDRARELHEKIDGWKSPDSNSDGIPDIRVVQIAGWGIPETVKGMTYFAKEILDKTICDPTVPIGGCEKTYKWVLDVRPDFTTDGDGTVVLPSAVEMGELTNYNEDIETYYVNLYDYNAPPGPKTQKDRSHSSILEVENVRDLIKNIVTNKIDPAGGLKYIKGSQDSLPKNNVGSYLRMAMHSPVDVHVYDSAGNHVGVAASSTDELNYTDEEISNSYYVQFGEGKYLGVPLRSGEQYTIKLEGTGSGIFTFEMFEEQGGNVQLKRTFSHIPVSTSTKSTLTFAALGDVADLILDDDGNGIPDRVALTDEARNDVTFDSIITALGELPSSMSDTLAKQVQNAEKQANKGNLLPARMILEAVQRQLFVYTKPNMPKKLRIEYVDALRISAILDVLTEEMQVKQEEKKNDVKEKIEAILDNRKK